ncbi:MAG: sel1 repeat family protein [Azonexus sp.]|jgi:TPR repeat protein|uniref:tetratricopeptide repeat protein n=1 Tax=Azonexus sp. TaxID=1872668 RepID=UPI00282CAA23|nr:tetratricopeptide repeat protein [Azonexus sp.]MDR0776459.1 sel1 repeat family protein [Azonexus sp.]
MQAHISIEEAAHDAWDAGNLAEAFHLFEQCANAGSATSMLDLGYFYDEGLGTDQNKTEAMRWYKRAHRRGDSGAAANNIAILYRETGRFRLCYQWFERSAKLGNGDSEVELAKLLLSGQGVRRSVVQASKALKRAQISSLITPAGREEAEMLLVGLTDAA